MDVSVSHQRVLLNIATLYGRIDKESRRGVSCGGGVVKVRASVALSHVQRARASKRQPVTGDPRFRFEPALPVGPQRLLAQPYHALAFDTIILALQCLLPLLSADQIAVRQILCKVSQRIWTATADCNRCTCLECAFIIASNIDIDVHFRRTTLQLMAPVPLEVYDGTCSSPCTR